MLDYLTLQLDNEKVYNEAGSAICDIARHSQLKKASIPVLEQIAETSTDEALAKRAGALATEFSN